MQIDKIVSKTTVKIAKLKLTCRVADKSIRIK
jgi:hypothetical protein